MMKPTTVKADPTVSAFFLAWKEEEPKLHEFDVSGFFGLGDKPLPKIGIRVARKEEEDQAVQAAHDYVAKVASGVEAVKTDNDIVNDAKLVEILYRVCRNPANPMYPLFPSPTEMRKRLSTDHVGCLMNLYNQVRAREGGLVADIADERVEAAVEIASKTAGTNLPEELFARMSREYLIHLVVLISLKLQAARGELAAMTKDAEAASETATTDPPPVAPVEPEPTT